MQKYVTSDRHVTVAMCATYSVHVHPCVSLYLQCLRFPAKWQHVAYSAIEFLQH
jgi:hypothetical protein